MNEAQTAPMRQAYAMGIAAGMHGWRPTDEGEHGRNYHWAETSGYVGVRQHVRPWTLGYAKGHDVRRHLGPDCEVREGDWPYECVAKDRHPTDVVWHCDTHRCWWHLPAELGMSMPLGEG